MRVEPITLRSSEWFFHVFSAKIDYEKGKVVLMDSDQYHTYEACPLELRHLADNLNELADVCETIDHATSMLGPWKAERGKDSSL